MKNREVELMGQIVLLETILENQILPAVVELEYKAKLNEHKRALKELLMNQMADNTRPKMYIDPSESIEQ